MPADFDSLDHAAQQAALEELANAALPLWGLAGGTARLVNLSENATYAVEGAADGRRHALRIHRAGYHSPEAIASELAWARALRGAGIVVTPNPVPGRDGGLIQSMAHPSMDAPRNMVLFDWEAASSRASATTWRGRSRRWAR